MLEKITVIGAGNMGEALLRGILRGGVVSSKDLKAVEVRETRAREVAEAYGISVVSSLPEGVSGASCVVLAVKPEGVQGVCRSLGDSLESETLVISVAAGIPLSSLESWLPPGTRVVRAMPNTPALILEGMTALSPGTHATQKDLQRAQRIFETVGRVVVLPERDLDAVTGLSASGPAYVYLFIEALADGGVRMGLSREVALLLAAQMVRGAATLVLESGEHPGVLKDRVMSPGGTTAEGVFWLESRGIRGGVMEAVAAATRRARELARGKEEA